MARATGRVSTRTATIGPGMQEFALAGRKTGDTHNSVCKDYAEKSDRYIICDDALQFEYMEAEYTEKLPFRGRIRRVIRSNVAKVFVYVAIICSGALLGWDATFGGTGSHKDSNDSMIMADTFITMVFAAECAAKLYVQGHLYFGNWEARMLNKWNTSDFVITGFSCLYLGVIYAGLAVTWSRFAGFCKMIRLFRLVRVFEMRKELMVIVEGFGKSICSLFWVVIVLFVLTYGSTVFCMDMLRDRSAQYQDSKFDPEKMFGTIPKSMLTLFSMLILAEWSDIVRPVFQKQPHMVLFFVGFTIIVTFGLMNVVVGIIVETMSEVEAEHRQLLDAKTKEVNLNKFKDILSKIAQRSSIFGPSEEMISAHGAESYPAGGFTQERFIAQSTGELQDLMDSIDFPQGFSTKDLFNLLDDSGDGVLNRKEFLQGMFRIIQGDPFQHFCMIQLGINNLRKMIAREMGEVKSSLKKLQQDADFFHEEAENFRKTKPAEEVLRELLSDRTSEKIRSTLGETNVGLTEGATEARSSSSSAPPEKQKYIQSELDKRVAQEPEAKLADPQDSDLGVLDPMRFATLRHCQEELRRAKKQLEMQDANGKTAGLPPGYWSPDPDTFSKQEEYFLVWANLYDAISQRNASECRRWVHHAQNIGIQDCIIELEEAYGERLSRSTRGPWASSQRVANAVDRGEWVEAVEHLIESCIARGARRSVLQEALMRLLNATSQPAKTCAI